MTAEKAIRYLEQVDEDLPSYDLDTEKALEAIKEALMLAHDALMAAEWETWDLGDAYCIWCGNGRHVGHDSGCKRRLALASIRESDESPKD